MEKLIATFDLPLSTCLIFRWPESDHPELRTSIDGFDVRIMFPRHHFREGHGKASETYMTRAYEGVEICVSREEREVPPERYPKPEREGEFISVPYFDDRAPQYRRAAIEALNRLLAYLRGKLCQPFIRFASEREAGFRNPRWTDEGGRDVGRAFIGAWVVMPVPGMHGMKLGVKPFEKSQVGDLEAALKHEPTALKLYEEFLLNAQEAALSGDLRRAVLELAISCEVAVKQRIFAHPSPASAALEYLEKKRSISITELIANVELGGHSFSAQDREAYRGIKELFRCRNKIAHRGESNYRDDQGTAHRLDEPTIQRWWDAVERLIRWLS